MECFLLARVFFAIPQGVPRCNFAHMHAHVQVRFPHALFDMPSSSTKLDATHARFAAMCLQPSLYKTLCTAAMPETHALRVTLPNSQTLASDGALTMRTFSTHVQHAELAAALMTRDWKAACTRLPPKPVSNATTDERRQPTHLTTRTHCRETCVWALSPAWVSPHPCTTRSEP